MQFSLMKKCKSFLTLLLITTLFLPSTSAYASSLPPANQSTSTVVVMDTTQISNKNNNSISFEKYAEKKADICLNTFGITSMSYAISDSKQITQEGYYGLQDKKAQLAPTNQTLYGIGSVSKIFTTIAVLKLVEQGKVELDKPVTTYVPSFKMADKRYKDITVRMLLNHSSGLMGSNFHNAFLLNDNDTSNYDNFLQALSKEHLKYRPGSCSVYCNDGFALAEILISQVSNISFTEFINKYILEPLNLTHTQTPQTPLTTEKLAKTYNVFGQEQCYEVVNTIGAGGIYSSAPDLAQFGCALTKDFSSIISYDLSKSMGNKEYANGFFPEFSSSDIAYGLGWDTVSCSSFQKYGITAYEKGGDTLSYHASLIVVPEYNLSISVLSSSGSSSILTLYATNILLEYMSRKGIITLKEDANPNKLKKATVPDQIKKYSGDYINISETYSISFKNNQMILSSGGSSAKFNYSKSGYFFNSQSDTQLRFVKHNNNIYLERYDIVSIPSLSSITLHQTLGVKQKNNPISNTVKKAWEARLGKIYYPIDEKYSSMYYILLSLKNFALNFKTNYLKNGYISNMKIIDKNTCYHSIELPVMSGRDGTDIHFFKKDGVEYAQANDRLYMSDAGFKTLSTKKNFSIEIPDSSYNQYYKIPSKIAQKNAIIQVPENASFIVYDKNGVIQTNYYLAKKTKVKLPPNGLILFMGDAQSKFSITIK